jgi:serine/threonine-protein kinase
MGAVWVAEHLMLKTEVVVKFMADALASDPVSLARFSREAAAAASVKSPHVVQMLDHGFTADGTPFIVMELLEGEDLKMRMVREHVVPMHDLHVIVNQACKALARAHAAGIVHRDIKPENIFLCHTDDGEPFVKLLDFGIAKSASPADFQMTQTGVTVGTPFYMSPEQAMGSPPVDATTDLWSLGVVAYEAMTGERPFDGPTLGALTMAICNHGPPVPSAVNAQISPAVDAWMARACARDRANRFQTAKAMSEALASALGVRGGSARPPSESGEAQSIPLAFEATSISQVDAPVAPRSPPAPVARSTPPPPPAPVVPPAASSEPNTEPAPSFGTTTNPLSRTHNPAASGALPPPPGAAPAPPGPRSRPRLASVAGGAVALAVGIAAWVTLSPRHDVAPTAAAPTSPVSENAAPAAPDPVVAPASASTTPWLPAPEPPPTASARTTSPSAAAQPTSTSARTPPAPSSVASVARGLRPLPGASASAAPPSAPSGCNPPYYLDAAHNKVFKPECL